MPALAQGVHLRCRSCYSFGLGTARPAALARRAAEQGMPMVGLADFTHLHGAVEFHLECRKHGIRAIHGLEVRCRFNDAPDPDPPRAWLTAETQSGFRHLIALSTQACSDPDRTVRWTDIAARAEGLLLMEGGPDSALGRALARDDAAAARAALARALEVFGPERLGLEVRAGSAGMPPRAAAVLIAYSKASGIPALATWDVRGVETDSPDGWGTEATRRAAFAERPELLSRTLEWAARCQVQIEHDGPRHFPRADATRPPGADAEALEDLVRRALRARLDAEPASPERQRVAMDRLRVELEAIQQAGYVNYFLVWADVARCARERGIPVGPGRGKAANSLVAWVLGLTGLDPLQHGFHFERLLNLSHPVTPDIDLDVCAERRMELVDYLRRRYGPDHVALISAFTSLGPRHALREAGRDLGRSEKEIESAAAVAPDSSAGGLARWSAAALAQAAGGLEWAAARAWYAAARAREHLPHAAAVHPSGVLIAPYPLDGHVPLMMSHDSQRMSQWDAASLDRCGYIKMDVSGLRAVTALQRATVAPGGRPPTDDSQILDVFRSGRTAGIYVFESPSMKGLVTRAQPESAAELAALVALHRNTVLPALNAFCAHTPGVPPGVPPKIVARLADTRGVLVFEEQIVDLLMEESGWTAARADRLRAAWASLDESLAGAMEEEWKREARRRRMRAAAADAMARWLAEGARQAFSRAHAEGILELAWQMARAKRQNPAAFYAAAWPPTPAHDGKSAQLLHEAVAAGVRLRPPDIQRSHVEFTAEADTVRWGLAGIRMVTPEAAQAWVAERERGGPFKSVEDFCYRAAAPAQHRAVEYAMAAGAFDFTGQPREGMIRALSLWMRSSAERHRDAQRGQGTLFEPAAAEGLAPSGGHAWTREERDQAEKQALGVVLSAAD